MSHIPERDWKTFRALKDELLDIACKRALDKVVGLIDEKGDKPHEAYLALWKLMREADHEIALMFDDPRRSNVIFNLLALRRNGLLTDERLSRLSQETQGRILGMLEERN